MCEKFLNTDRQTINWFIRSNDSQDQQLLIENKLSLLPLICKYGAQKTSLKNAQHDDIYLIALEESEQNQLDAERNEINQNFLKAIKGPQKQRSSGPRSVQGIED